MPMCIRTTNPHPRVFCSLVETEVSEDYVSYQLGVIAEYERQIADLTSQIEKLKKGLVYVATEAIKKAPTPDEQKEIATQLYWFNDNINATDITTAMGTISIGIAKALYKAWLTIPCCECGKDTRVYLNSRSHRKDIQRDLRKGHNHWRCDSCQEEYDLEKQASSVKWAEQQELRRQHLIMLKTMPYAEYLKTEHWQETRRQALKSARYRCHLCNSNGELHVHHRTYERRGEEYMKDLIVLCANCHAKFHDKLPEQNHE